MPQKLMDHPQFTDCKAAMAAYNTAVKTYGPKSDEAKTAAQTLIDEFNPKLKEYGYPPLAQLSLQGLGF